MSDSEEKKKKVYDHMFKVLLSGDAKVGKTSLKLRYVDNKFSREYQMNSGVDFAVKNTTVNDQKVKLHLWDTPGSDMHREKADPYYGRAHAVLLVFDVADPHSFGNLATWHSKARDLCPDGFIFLVGNKTDIKEDRRISSEDATALAAKLKIGYVEVSVKDNLNVNDMFVNIVKTLLDSKAVDHRGRAWWNKK